MKTKTENKEQTSNELYKVLGVAYYEILKYFCSTDKYRDWLTKPFKIGNKIHSSDAHFLVTTDLSKVKADEEIKEIDPKKLNNVLITDTNTKLVLNVKEIKEVFKKAPQEDCYDFKGQDVECRECDGYGWVEWEYKHHTKDTDCPICDGEGKTSLAKKIKNGETKIEEHLTIEIGTSLFYVNKFQRLIYVADKLGEKEITLIYQSTPNKGNLFKIKDLEILVMPCMRSDDNNENIVASYT